MALFVDSFLALHLQELSSKVKLSQEHVQLLDQLINAISLGKQIVAFKVCDTNGVQLRPLLTLSVEQCM